VEVTVCEFCNGYGCFKPEASGVCPTDNSSSFRMNPAGIASVKTGVGGNSAAGGGDATENDWEKALDAMEKGVPKARLAGGDELVLLLPSVRRRMAARRVINSTSMGFLGICQSPRGATTHCAVLDSEFRRGRWVIWFVLGVRDSR
jgi:hypothetical protein